MLNILTFTGEIDKKKTPYTELYNLLGTDGLKLSQEVMAAIIFRKTGKSTKTLTGQEKNNLKEVLSEEHRRILESENECGTSFHVSYGLHQIYICTLTKHSLQNPVGVSQLREKILVLEMIWRDKIGFRPLIVKYQTPRIYL